jgi:carboxymethylenebutenolidase
MKTDRSFFAEPKNVDAATPAVVIAMHVWGVDADMRAAAQRFADNGYLAAVPDLYAGFDDVPDGDCETDYTLFMPFAKQLQPDQVDAALRAAHDRLRERSKGKIAVAGFCMGGRIALARTTQPYAALFSAAAIWYGQITIEAEAVVMPIVGSYASEDTGIPQAGVSEFQSKLRVPNDIVVYPDVKHAFADATRSVYDESAAEDSWRRTLDFLGQHLK